MDRRRFLQGATASVLPIVLGGFSVRAFGRTPLLELIGQAFQSTGRSLVVIQLAGGNDGLNMIIPHAMSQYYQRRPSLAIPASNVIQLNNVMGMHPAMQPLRTLYDNGKLAIIQGVGYENPNRSHFRSTDIWLSGSDSTVTINTGWLGRDLLYRNPGYPGQLPPSPLALQIGGSPSLALQSANGGMGVTITDPNQFYQLITGTVGFVEDPPPNTPAGAELRFLRTIEQEAIQFATVIKQAADRVTNQTTYPNTGLASQLAIVARLIAGGLFTPIYMVQLGGFDTHSSQLTRHQQLLGELAGAITAFQTDLQLLGVDDIVVGMTFSEFGRRIAENGSAGTDHGTSSPQLIFGSRINGGFHGPNPDFTRLDQTGDFIYDIDFRRVYATILGHWFGADEAELQAVLFQHFDPVPFITTTTRVSQQRGAVQFSLGQNYPNPFNPSTQISYSVRESGFVSLKVFDVVGREVRTLVNENKPAGTYSVTFDGSNLPSGIYIYRLQAGGYVETKKMSLVR